METGRRRRGRPKYTVLDISSRVDDVNVDNNGSSKEETAALESEEVIKEKDIKENKDGFGQEASERDIGDGGDKEGRTDLDNIDAKCSEDFPDDFDFEENLWEADEEERGRKRDKEAEYHLFVKTHQKRRHRGTRHRARSSS